MTLVAPRQYAGMAAIRAANAEIGHHFFDAGTMRFFNSHIVAGPFGGRYFVTSERCGDSDPRRFTIRMALDSGEVDTVGDFQEFATLEAATAEARELAAILPPDGSEPCRRTLALVRPGWPAASTTHAYAYSGTIPNTGPRRCTLCGRAA